MSFDIITDDERLWAVKYEGNPDNALYMLFEQWNDVTLTKIEDCLHVSILQEELDMAYAT